MTLAEILATHGISQAQLAAGVLRPDGKPYSVAAINRLIRHHEYPKTADPAALRAQIETRLADLGITVAVAWPASQQPWEYPEMQVLTQQARQLFRLPKSPFVDDVQTRDDVYLSDEQRYIRQNMLFAAKQAGFVAIIGESGADRGHQTNRRADYRHPAAKHRQGAPDHRPPLRCHYRGRQPGHRYPTPLYGGQGATNPAPAHREQPRR